VCAAAACGQRAAPNPPAASARIAIVATERASGSALLVALDEHGDRQFALVQRPDGIARDTNPAVSPDAHWLVFASSRGRKLDETSLWIAPLAPDAVPVPLTHGPAIDTHPVWTPDGGAIVFASTRAGTFDLFRLAIAGGRAAGEPVALTSAPTHEITPTIAADGTIIYAAVTPAGDGSVETHLEQRAPDGTITRLTDGPADSSPALSPDGMQLAFVRPAEHGSGVDGDLWLLPRKGDKAYQLADLPLTDEGGPVWSRDGRFVFATSLLRGAAGNPLFSSVIVIDTRAHPRTPRILEDRVGAIARLTPAIAAAHLDAAALDSDPEYIPELARITAAAIAAQKHAGQ
jgi:dipeptidyl aminopeptidase/acylaminoacyl peptidase